MKITEVESFTISGHHYVRVFTDEGLSGLGQSACWAYPQAVHEVVLAFKEYLVGKDPRDIERHWNHLFRMGPFRGSILMGALSAIDIALWDLQGKRLGVPIWELLGGRARDRVRMCEFVGGGTDEEFAASIHEAKALGFTAIKMAPCPPGFRDFTHQALAESVRHSMEVARAAAGDMDIVVEFGRNLSAPQAKALIEIVQPFTPLFIEDPIQIDSIRDQGRFAASVSAPMAIGERLISAWEFSELFEYGGPQVVRADIGLAGGFTHMRKIAAIAQGHNSTLAPHNCLGPVLTAAIVHFDIATPNFLVQEYYRTFDDDPSIRGMSGILRLDRGYISAPEAPGLGIEIDRDQLVVPTYLLRKLHEIPVSQDGYPG